MSRYVHAQVGRLFCVQWRDTPSVEDMRVLSAKVSELAATLKQPIVYLTFIHPDEGAPPPAVQDALFEFFGEMKRYCESMHLVILGEGFRQTVVRSIVTTGMLLSGLPKFILVHEDLKEALAEVGRRLGLEPAEVGKALADGGVRP